MKIISLLSIILLLIAGLVQGQVQHIVIENPGATGLNTYFGDDIPRKTDATELVNFDIIGGDLVKRLGAVKVYDGSDTLCDGIEWHYDRDGNARLLRFVLDGDTSVINFGNPNSFTFSADSIVNMYLYPKPTFGYDVVHFGNSVFAANGKNHPTVYSKDQWGTISMPTPGAPMVAVMNKSAGLDGTYAYKFHFFNPTDVGGVTGWGKKSYPGPSSAYIMPDSEMVALWGFPGTFSGAASLDATSHIVITRTKADGSNFYFLDSFSYDSDTAENIFYIDSISDASLGSIIYKPDSTIVGCCSTGMHIPGSAYNISWAGAGNWTPVVLGFMAKYDTLSFAYSYLDTNLGIESEMGPWLSRYGDSVGADTLKTYFHAYLQEFASSDFIDGIVVYCSFDSTGEDDTTTYRVFDTIYGLNHSTDLKQWDEDQPYAGLVDSTEFYERTDIHPYILTNKIPYKYLEYSFARFWGAGDEDYPSRLYYSERTDTSVSGGGGLGYWDMTFDYLTLNEDDGDRITGLASTPGGLYAFKGYSIWLVTGTDPQSDMRLAQLPSNMGAYSNSGITIINGIVYFVAPNKRIYALSGYQAPVEISTRINDKLDSLDNVYFKNVVTFGFDRDLWVAFPTDTLIGATTYYYDSIYICDVDNPDMPWRVYKLPAENLTIFDSTATGDYPRLQELIYSKNDDGDLYYFGYGDTVSTDAGSAISSAYKSPPLLIDGDYIITGGTIQADVPFDDTFYVRVGKTDGGYTSTSMIINDGTQIGDCYKFHCDSPIGSKFYVEVYDSGKCATFRLKRIVVDYREYARRF